jgi:hypothetical protein
MTKQTERNEPSRFDLDQLVALARQMREPGAPGTGSDVRRLTEDEEARKQAEAAIQKLLAKAAQKHRIRY